MIKDKIKYNSIMYELPLTRQQWGEVEVIYRPCRKIKEKFIDSDMRKLKIIDTSNRNTDYTRNCTEHAFYSKNCRNVKTDTVKRISGNSNELDNKFKISPEKTELLFLKGTGTVSYTHLDVYKRQSLHYGIIIICLY